MTHALECQFGQSFIADNHGSANNIIGSEIVVKAAAEDQRKGKAVFDALATDEEPLAQVALRFVQSNADISCAIIGSAELHPIDEACQGAAMSPLSPYALAGLDALYESNFGRRQHI